MLLFGFYVTIETKKFEGTEKKINVKQKYIFCFWQKLLFLNMFSKLIISLTYFSTKYDIKT